MQHDHPVDPQGMCHNFFESRYDNNVAEAPITIPVSRPGRTGFGPGGGKTPPDLDPIDDENRPSTSDGT